MRYYKHLDGEGDLQGLLTSERPMKTSDLLIEITEEEYNAVMEEILSAEPDEPIGYTPSYEEYAEAYSILTGGEASE